MNESKDIEILERYIRGELSDDDRANLELRLQSELELSNQLTQILDVQNAIRYARLIEKSKEIELWESNEEQDSVVESEFEKDVSKVIRMERNREIFNEIKDFEKKQTRLIVFNKLWFRIAASFILTIGLGLFLMTYITKNEGEKLAVVYYEPYPVIGNVRGSNKSEIRTKAYGDYLAGDFKEAINGFERLEEDYDSLAIFYLGVAHMGNNNPDKCIKTLQSFQKEYDFLEIQSSWYIGLANLKIENKIEAIKYFRIVKEKNEYKAKESTEIIKQLERISNK